MRKKTIICASLLMVSNLTFAGGLLTNTNQNIAFNRNFARNATFEIDGAYSNPAGLAWIGEGYHFSLNIQSAYQTRNIATTFAPFAMNVNKNLLGQDGTKRFEGDAAAPILPSAQFAWQEGKWTISANFAVSGGGGKCSFDAGLPSFESQVALLPAVLSQAGIPSNQYGLESSMYGRQYFFGLQGGVTYRILDNEGDLHQGLSVYLGARMNYVSNRYKGNVSNISAAIEGNMTNLNRYFTDASEQALQGANSYKLLAEQAQMEGHAELAQQYSAAATKYGVAAKTYEAYANKTADIELDCSQTGWGLTPIIGIDYRVGNLNLGARYEHMTNLNIENDTKINTTGLNDYDNGVNTPNDIPAILSFGAQYEVLPTLRVMGGWTYYFDKNAGMAGGKQKYLKHNTSEITLGAEWDCWKYLTVSGGYMNTNYGMSDDFQSDLSFSCDSYSIGFGGKIKVSPKVDVNVAYFWSTYSDYTKNVDNYANSGLSAKNVYSRTNKVFGAGVNFRF